MKFTITISGLVYSHLQWPSKNKELKKKHTHTQQTLNKTQWRWGEKDKMRTKNKKENTNMMEQQWKRQANRTENI